MTNLRDKLNRSRDKLNRSVAETIADIKCNSSIDGNTSPEFLIRERKDVMKTLTNPIKLSNVADTAKNMPSDIAEGIGSIMKMPIAVAQNLMRGEVVKGVRSMITGQLAPVTNIGSRFATSVRNNQ
jgi:hypothetical protein